MLDAQEIFDSWSEEPPVAMAFHAFLKGLGGAKSRASSQPRSWQEAMNQIPANDQRAAAAQIAAQLGTPILRKDPALEKMRASFDEDVIGLKARERIAERLRQDWKKKSDSGRA